MKGMTLWLALAGVEMAVLLLGLLLFAWLRAFTQQRRMRRAAHALVAKVGAGRKDREDAIQVFLSVGMGMGGEALKQAAVAIVRGEMCLYRTFANLILRRDAGAVAAFDLALEAAVQPYWQLDGPGAASAPQQPEDGGELSHLREENHRLSQELQVTMDTMGRMLSEYSTMFAAEHEGYGPAKAGVTPVSPEAIESSADAEASADQAPVEVAGEPETGPDPDEVLAPAPVRHMETVAEPEPDLPGAADIADLGEEDLDDGGEADSVAESGDEVLLDVDVASGGDAPAAEGRSEFALDAELRVGIPEDSFADPRRHSLPMDDALFDEGDVVPEADGTAAEQEPGKQDPAGERDSAGG